MLPLGTTAIGTDVPRIICGPYQKDKTTRRIRAMMMAVWKYSFFHSFLMVAVKVWLPLVSGMLCLDVAFGVLIVTA
jgi:hypothetical protein